MHNLNLGQMLKSWTVRFAAAGAIFNGVNAATGAPGVDPQSVIALFHLDPQWAAVVTGIFAALAIYNRAHPVQGVPGKDPALVKTSQ